MQDDKNKNEWYGNKELYEMFLSLKKEFLDLKSELSLTRQFIKQYNHLQQTVNMCMDKIDALEKMEDFATGMSRGKRELLFAIRKWGGWIVAIISSTVMICSYFF